MYSSPRTPTCRRQSDINDSFTSPGRQSAGYSPQSNCFSSPQRPSHSRQSSSYSIPSPSTPRPVSFGAVSGFDSTLDSGNGLGNLADELAGAWDEDAEVDTEGGREISCNGHAQIVEGGVQHHQKDNCFVLSEVEELSGLPLSSPRLSMLSKHRQKRSQYKGSDHLDDYDLEGALELSSLLEARIAAVESLVRQGTKSNGGDADNTVQRLAGSLRDLGSQSSLEQSATRLTTTHTALTTHITHQTRLLQSLTHPIFSPLSIPPPPSFIDDLLPLFASLHLLLPAPNPNPLASMLSLRSSTADLLSTLAALSDSLHMARQITSLASRRLQAAREMVDELRREEEVREQGVRWVEKGRWDDRLASRECARVCGEVVGGFEEVCKGWREKIAGGGIGGKGGLEVGAG